MIALVVVASILGYVLIGVVTSGVCLGRAAASYRRTGRPSEDGNYLLRQAFDRDGTEIVIPAGIFWPVTALVALLWFPGKGIGKSVQGVASWVAKKVMQ